MTTANVDWAPGGNKQAATQRSRGESARLKGLWMEVRFPTRDMVHAALVALLQAKGYDQSEDWVDVAVLSKGGLPAYRVTPASQAVSVLAAELASITGRSLAQEPSWVLLQGDVNLLFGAVRQVSPRGSARSLDHTL